MESLSQYKVRLYYLLVCVAVTLPFSMKVNNLFVILLFVNWIFQRKRSFTVTFVLLPAFFYAMHVGGLFFTSNMAQGLFELEKKVSFVVFSIVLSTSTLFDQSKFNNILLAFVASCLLASMICLGHAIFQLVTHGTYEYFFYHSLTEILGIHAIYMAMYICFCIFILISIYIRNIFDQKSVLRYIFLLILVYLSIFLFLLSARLVIMSFILMIVSGLLLYGYKRKLLLKMSAIAIFLVISFSSLILFIPSNLDRFKEAINYRSEYSIDKQYGGRSTRELIWSCSLQVIKENVFFGVGPGDTQDALQQCYKLDENKNWALLYRPDFQYNAHSQYLQTFIDLGILGVFMFLATLVIPAIIAIKYNDYLLMSFVALFLLACITESMLELNKGIVFFAFFISIFLNRYNHRQIVQP